MAIQAKFIKFERKVADLIKHGKEAYWIYAKRYVEMNTIADANSDGR